METGNVCGLCISVIFLFVIIVITFLSLPEYFDTNRLIDE